MTVAIGLELHVRLATGRRLLSRGSIIDGAAPNAHVDPWSVGEPGAMPVLDERALMLALRAAAVFECDVHAVCGFDRKHYAWPDLPKGYQVTQHERPLAVGGHVVVATDDGERTVALRGMHIEEDTAAAKHDEHGTALDYDRSGAPLVEIVTEPCIDSPALAAACFREVRDALVAAGVTEGRMEWGHLRCDANVSVGGGPRVEVKGLNSFRFLEQAVTAEIARQRAVLQGGGVVEQSTRRYDRDAHRTVPLRDACGEGAYLYLPEPDLPDVVVTRARVEAVLADLAALPTSLRRHGLDPAGRRIGAGAPIDGDSE